ncbi:MAG: dihydroorotate dehydrogenase [Spirochaetaceae bacterium]|nr:MAG: dihydroorotate dehydrogenase [Spirochaetaceae bacterium]
MDLSVKIGSETFANPLGVASGTFGYGSEYEKLIDLPAIGTLYTKAVTPRPRPGNSIPRIIETASGLLNSIGLANVGMAGFIEQKLPFLATLSCSVVVNVAGDDPDEYREVVEYLDRHDAANTIKGYEVNISCPNVKCGGLALGTDPRQVEELTRLLKKTTDKPIIMKLTPNVTDITVPARAAEAGGADAVSCINTLVGMVIDTRLKKTVLPAGTGGLSGPAIFPVALAMVYRTARTVTIPVIGLGGIMTADHAVQFLLAGASAVQVGTANFVDPNIAVDVLRGIETYAETERLTTIRDFHSLLD